MSIKIIIPGKPIAKARPRFARMGKFVRTYSDQESAASYWVQIAIGQIKKPLDGPVKLKAFFYLPRPKSHFGTGRNSGILKSTAPELPTTKPDVDNYVKFALDCLNGLAWKDDGQVYFIGAVKMYGENPRTEIEIGGPS